MAKHVIKPVVVAIDETSKWEPTITRTLGRAYGVYLYDAATVTHCCEFTPSYWLIQIQNLFERGVDDGAPELAALKVSSMSDLEWGVDSQDDCYMHCHHVEAIPPERRHALEDVAVGDDEDVDEVMDALRQELVSNPEYFPACHGETS